MAHNKDGFEVEDGQIDRTFTPRKSRSERRNASNWADELAAELVAQRSDDLERIPLSSHTLEAIRQAQTITRHGAKRRQMMYISKLLRAVEPEPIRAALDAESEGVAFAALERWRDRILAEGDAAISTFLEEHPEGDRQQIRQQARVAAKAGDKGVKARKQLFQLLREAAGI